MKLERIPQVDRSRPFRMTADQRGTIDPSLHRRCLFQSKTRPACLLLDVPNDVEWRLNTVLTVLLVLSSAAPQVLAPRPVRVAGAGYEGAIVSAETLLADPRNVKKPASFWTPTEADIREAEARLSGYLTSPEAAAVVRGTRIGSELTRYRRQYWGTVVRGQRHVLMLFVHADSSPGRSGLWYRGAFVVMGGGDQFFRVSYDVRTRRFSGLRVNAPE